MSQQPAPPPESRESEWSREWRTQISKEVESSADKHEKAAVIQERILGMLNDHDRRLGLLEGKPDGLRANLGSYGGCVSQLVYAGFSAINLLIAVIAILLSLFYHHP